MLTLWRRHKETCKHKDDRYFRRCSCAMWCEGTVEGRYERHSLKTRSWERAVELANDIEEGKKEATTVTLKKSTDTFILDLNAQNRAGDTVRKYQLLFKQLTEYGTKNNLSHIRSFTFDILVNFRGEWKEEGTATRNKKLDRLKAFFRFCHDAGWVQSNPTRPIKAGVTMNPMVKPFTPEEQALLLSKPQTRQIRCFVRILYHSALRISDAAMLRPEDFDGNKIRRGNQKKKQTQKRRGGEGGE